MRRVPDREARSRDLDAFHAAYSFGMLARMAP